MQEENKSLAINSIYSVLYKVVNVLYPLLTATYVARILLADGVGKVAFAQNIVQYFVIIAALGIPNYGIREIAKVRFEESMTNKLFSELVLINGISTTVCTISYYLMVLLFPFFEANRTLFLLAGITLILNYFNVDWYYQGVEQYGYIAKRNCVVKLVSLILVFVLIHSINDYLMYALIYSLAIAGNYCFNVYNLRGKVKLIFRDLDLKRHLKPVLILLASSISIELYTLVDTTMLGTICSDTVVGYYTNSVKLARIINSTIASIALVLLPRLSFYYSDKQFDKLRITANKVYCILATLAIPSAIGLFMLAEEIIYIFYGASFMPAVVTLKILSVLVVAVALNNFFGTQILMTFGLESKLLASVIIGAIVNILLNSVLIPTIEQNGAAVASVISEICVLIATYYFASKFVHFSLGWKYWTSLFFNCIVLIIVVYAVKLINLSAIISLLLATFLGAISFGALGLILRNDGVICLFNAGKIVIKKIRKDD